MLRSLVATCLSMRALTVALAALVAGAGIATLRDIPLDVFPEFAPPIVEIQTEAPGLSTTEVESLVTVPLESSLTGVSWLKKLRSKSVPGLSSVVMYFKPGTDLLRARQLVQERASVAARTLPEVARPPVMLSPLSSTSRVLKIGVSSKTLSLIELSTLARFTIRPALLAVPGVANVAIWGQRDRQLQVRVDPVRLAASRVTLAEVSHAAADATRPVAGGFVDTPTQRIGILHSSGITRVSDLAKVPVRASGAGVLTLGDVAELVEGHQPLIGDGVINGAPGLLLIVEKQPWGNTLEVTQRIEKVLSQLAPGLRGVHVDSTIFRPATFIEQSVSNLREALILGCLLVVVVLFAFMGEWRSALISVIAIPLSLLAAGLVLYLRGGTLNTMVLAGLVIALGEVVDDAIIDVENIGRRLRLARGQPSPRSVFEIVLEASVEMRSSIVYATLIVVAALVPVLFMEGLSGAFFQPLALSYGLAVLASLVVALTITPVLSMLLLPEVSQTRRGSRVSHWLHARYATFLPKLLERKRVVYGALLATFALGAVTLPFLGESLLPNFKERDFLMHWVEKPGTSHAAMMHTTIAAGEELMATPGVRNFGAHVGRAEVADEVVGINFTELWISIRPDVDYDATIAKVNRVVEGYPGLSRDLLTFLRERIKEVLSGESAALVVRVFGEDLEVLRTKAKEISAAMATVEGTVDLKVEAQIDVPELHVTVNLEKAKTLGLTPGQIRSAAATLIAGKKVGEVYEDQKSFDVVVRGVDELAKNPSAIGELWIDLPRGGQARLRDVADVAIVGTPGTIKREGASRRIDVTCNVKDRDLGAVAGDIAKRLAAIEFPRGYHAELLGEYAERQAASRRMLLLSVLSVLGIVVLLQTALGSLRLTWLALLSLPLALVGGLVAAAISGGVLSLGSLVGLVTVLGIAARNGIMLLSHYRHLQEQEGEPFGVALVLRGAQERLLPILMTALATGLALVPLVLAGDLPGHEIEHPMAVVILGGLVASTVLNLMLVPALYCYHGQKRA